MISNNIRITGTLLYCCALRFHISLSEMKKKNEEQLEGDGRFCGRSTRGVMLLSPISAHSSRIFAQTFNRSKLSSPLSSLCILDRIAI